MSTFFFSFFLTLVVFISMLYDCTVRQRPTCVLQCIYISYIEGARASVCGTCNIAMGETNQRVFCFAAFRQHTSQSNFQLFYIYIYIHTKFRVCFFLRYNSIAFSLSLGPYQDVVRLYQRRAVFVFFLSFLWFVFIPIPARRLHLEKQ